MSAAALLVAQPALADETCLSPYMAKIVGQEDYVYIWTLGVEGLGDAQDKLVTVDVNPASAIYGKVVHSLSVGGRNEATIPANCGQQASIPTRSSSSTSRPIRPSRV